MTSPTLQVTMAGRHKPALPPGNYTVTADQQTPGAALSTIRTIDVRAPRFALDAADVVAVHPTPGDVGDLSRVLPHIALRESALPWARSQKDKPDVPWIALLVLRDGDARGAADSTGLLTSRRVKDLDPHSAEVLAPKLTVTDDEGEQTCLTVDLDSQHLVGLLPTPAELPWLAHVRTIALGTSGKSDEEHEPPPGWQAGDFGIVTTNRLPRTAGLYTAVLVSLEGFAEDVLKPGSKQLAVAKTVRMIALWSWTFTATSNDKASFHALADRLVADSNRDEALLRLPRTPVTTDGQKLPKDVEEHVTARLTDGAVPVAWQLPTGERTAAWYRGPFTAQPAPDLKDVLPAGKPAFTSADAALVLWPKQGLIDVGYAAAFTLGQLAALAHPELAWSVYKARKAAHHAVRASLGARIEITRDDKHGQHIEPTMPGHLQDALADDMAAALTSGVNALRGGPKHQQTETAHVGATSRLAGEGVTSGEVIAALTATPATAKGATAAKAGPKTASAGFAKVVKAAGQAVEASAHFHGDKVAQALPSWPEFIAQIPFQHLVPHAAMLPEHSIRFFHLDPLWLDAMVAGALRAQAVTALDHHVTTLLHDLIRGDELTTGPGTPPRTGALLRSPLISQWPDLIVEAFTSSTPAPANQVRITATKPLPDVLMLLFPDAWPTVLRLREPFHGLSMGLDDKEHRLILHAPQEMTVDGTKKQPGTSLGIWTESIATRPAVGGSEPEVLRIADDDKGCLRQRLEAAYKKAGVPAGHVLGPASAALQLINGARYVDIGPHHH
ncbi:hypothetical protein ACWIG3_32235 [Streptomyces celluloflavus]|uniref:hypothetical protein n=1 Tax=Streptomyces noursei TaxID=1971 RepID=UPI0005C9AEC9|nr:hypothetical protein [Streptomyces noursei]